MDRIILASGSPARKFLLGELNVPFEAVAADIDEDNHPERRPSERAQTLARLKAQKVRAEHPDAWVIGGDSLIVAHDGSLLEKPADADDARRMMQLQSGTWSVDHSAICIIRPDGEMFEGVDTGKVLFRDLDDGILDWWIGTDIWKGKAGAFQVMGVGQLLIRKIEGNYTSVMGFPIWLLGELFAKAGRPIQSFMKA